MSDQLVQLTEEVIEIDGKTIEITPKFQLFVKCFTDPTETDTFGNATQSAIKAYSLDPERQYNHAMVLGSRLLRKAKVVTRLYMENKHGLTYGKVLDLLLGMWTRTGNKKYFDHLLKQMDYEVPDDAPNTLIQNNVQVNNNTTVEDKTDFNSKFMEFMQKEYGK